MPININSKEQLIMQYYAVSCHFLPPQVKVKLSLSTIRRHVGCAGIQFRSFITAVLDGLGLHASVLLYLGTRTGGALWIGGWVWSRRDLDLLEDRRICGHLRKAKIWTSLRYSQYSDYLNLFFAFACCWYTSFIRAIALVWEMPRKWSFWLAWVRVNNWRIES